MQSLKFCIQFLVRLCVPLQKNKLNKINFGFLGTAAQGQMLPP